MQFSFNNRVSQFLRGAALAAFAIYAPLASALPAECLTTDTARGYQAVTCTPAQWNGVLVTYAHGWVAPQLPVTLPDLSLPGGSDMPTVFMNAGFAFATTSFKNGYAVEQGAAAINDAVDIFNAETSHPPAAKVLAMGLSLGSSITQMLIEKQPRKFHGGLALCGPVAGMPYEIRYIGDFRTVFDYFFPGIFGFGVVNVPPDAFLAWDAYANNVITAMMTNQPAVGQLFSVTHGAFDPADPTSFVQTALSAIFFDLFGINDAIATTGGIPYGNTLTWYTGSADDAALNAGIERVASDGVARNYTRKYFAPEGELKRPFVTLHNTQDPMVPYSHETVYADLVAKEGASALLTQIPVNRYGHCVFTGDEIMGAFGVLANQALK